MFGQSGSLLKPFSIFWYACLGRRYLFIKGIISKYSHSRMKNFYYYGNVELFPSGAGRANQIYLPNEAQDPSTDAQEIDDNGVLNFRRSLEIHPVDEARLRDEHDACH
jgi:hypothetical protein